MTKKKEMTKKTTAQARAEVTKKFSGKPLKTLWPASRANIWTQCPGSEKGASHSGKNFFAEADSFLKNNSILHELVASKFDSGIELSIEAKQLELSGDADALDLVNKAVEIVTLIVDYKYNKFIFVEKRFENDMFMAIPDLVIKNDENKEVTIFDFKFGYNPVEADNNLQLLIGVHLFLDSLSPKEKIKLDGYTFKGCIIQPTLNIIEMTEIFYDKDFFKTLKKKVAKSFFRVGYHCRYCNAKTTCKKLHESIKSFLKPLPVSDLKNRKAVWGELLQIAPAVKSLAEELQKEAKNFLSIGGDLPGWKLTKKPLRRMWVPGLEVEFLAKELKIPVKDFIDKRKKSPAQIEKVLKSKKKDKSLLNPFITQPLSDSLTKN